MKASLRSVRIAPKKAALVAKLIRGLNAAEAMEVLEHTNKKAARLLEELLRSAMANASHNDRQDPQILVIRTLIVNQAQAYHRGVPMARGRIRPMRKFMSHIHLTLGIADESEGHKGTRAKGANAERAKPANAPKTAKTSSQKKPAAVKDAGSTTTEKRKDTPKKPSDVPAS